MNQPQHHNGSNPRPPRVPVMTPPERMVWLASHRAEPYYRLVTVAEVAILEAQLKRAVVYETEFRSVVAILDSMGYWQDKPDVQTAVADATFDARRYQRATDSAIQTVDYLITALQTLANTTDGGCDEGEANSTVQPIIHDAANRAGETLAFLKAQAAAVREEPKPGP